ncbi:MAG: hypothetical protein QGI45_15920, partial [Myxococcota bacterium]|nr:hypothetical protein [Myxococcota bacterium]
MLRRPPSRFYSLLLLFACLHACTSISSVQGPETIIQPEKMGYTLLKYEEPGMGTLFQIQVWSQAP